MTQLSMGMLRLLIDKLQLLITNAHLLTGKVNWNDPNGVELLSLFTNIYKCQVVPGSLIIFLEFGVCYIFGSLGSLPVLLDI